MKGKLIKHEEDYYCIMNDKGEIIADVNGGNIFKLSLKNCQAIELGYDLDELAERTYRDYPHSSTDEYDNQKLMWNKDVHASKKRKAYIKGFQKALEILGDKKFSEEDMQNAHALGWDTAFEWAEGNSKITELKELINSLQQKEWDVEVVMEDSFIENGESYIHETGAKGNYSTHVKKPKLDQEGNLILKLI
jgi:hypothetical protein